MNISFTAKIAGLVVGTTLLTGVVGVSSASAMLSQGRVRVSSSSGVTAAADSGTAPVVVHWETVGR